MRAGARARVRAHRRGRPLRRRADAGVSRAQPERARADDRGRRRRRPASPLGIERDRALPLRPPRARRPLPRAAGGALRRRALDGLAADDAQPRRPRRVHAMGSHAGRAARRRGRGALGAGDRAAASRCSTRISRRAPSWAAIDFTMADIPIGCELHRWFGLPRDAVRAAVVAEPRALFRGAARRGPRRAACSTWRSSERAAAGNAAYVDAGLSPDAPLGAPAP